MDAKLNGFTLLVSGGKVLDEWERSRWYVEKK